MMLMMMMMDDVSQGDVWLCDSAVDDAVSYGDVDLYAADDGDDDEYDDVRQLCLWHTGEEGAVGTLVGAAHLHSQNNLVRQSRYVRT